MIIFPLSLEGGERHLKKNRNTSSGRVSFCVKQAFHSSKIPSKFLHKLRDLYVQIKPLTMAFTKWGPYTHLHLVWALIPIKPHTQWAFNLQVMCSSALIHLLLHSSSNTMWTTAGNYLLGNLSLVIVFVSFTRYSPGLTGLDSLAIILNPTRTTTAVRNYLLGNLSPLIVSVHSLDMHLA
jgi:hypothetical protein